MSKLAIAAMLITDSRNQGRDYKRKKIALFHNESGVNLSDKIILNVYASTDSTSKYKERDRENSKNREKYTEISIL